MLDTKLAFQVASYPCIRSFNFTRYTCHLTRPEIMSHVLARLKISKVPAYEDVLKLGREREGALLLDIGCCCTSLRHCVLCENPACQLSVGDDARKAALDGFPAKQIVASDLRRGENNLLFSSFSFSHSIFNPWPELWDLGHVLFRSSPKSFPATFLAGDALDPAFLSPFTSGAEPLKEVNLSNISTLNDLHGKVSAIWAASFFHVSFTYLLPDIQIAEKPFFEAFLREKSASTRTCLGIPFVS